MILTNDTIQRIKKDPLRVAFRALNKYVLGVLRYKRGKGYDAALYWQDRFSKYGNSIKGPGDEGLTENENIRMYNEAKKTFLMFCKAQKVSFKNAKVLEIGPGTGFYTDILKKSGVKNYTGLDITDVAFGKLRKQFPHFKFIKGDVTKSSLKAKFDIIVMIDVIEHIVEPDKFQKAMANIKSSLKPKGVFILAPLMQKSKRHLFYVRHWTLEDMVKTFPGFKISEPINFRNGQIIAVRK